MLGSVNFKTRQVTLGYEVNEETREIKVMLDLSGRKDYQEQMAKMEQMVYRAYKALMVPKEFLGLPAQSGLSVLVDCKVPQEVLVPKGTKVIQVTPGGQALQGTIAQSVKFPKVP